MSSPADVASVLLFAVVAVVFLHRSVKEERDDVPLWAYAATALACASGDILADQGRTVIGVLMLCGAVVAGVGIVMRKPVSGARAP